MLRVVPLDPILLGGSPANHPVQLSFLDLFGCFSGWVSEFSALTVSHF